MDILQLVTEIDRLNKKSKFRLIFDATGGFVELFNTSEKGFVLGLKSLLNTFKDIKQNFDLFIPHTNYVESIWRNLGSQYYKDNAANTMSTVQTKPLFATLSKFYVIANSDLHQYDDSKIDLTIDKLDNTISFLSNLIDVYKVDLNQLQQIKDANFDNEIIFDSPKLRTIIFDTFKYIQTNYNLDDVLKGHSLKNSLIEGRSYEGLTLPLYFNFETVLGLFSEEQTNESLKSAGTLRFHEEALPIIKDKFTYFTTQWTEEGDRNLTLANFNNFIADVSKNRLKIVKEGDIFRLVLKSLTSQNIIYYGAPGTGKSYIVDQKIKKLNPKYYERVTFHPEYDNASFVGGYKPVSVKKEEDKEEVTYRFVPQAFSSIYSRAWKDLDNHYYLVIEEINRGNCAEIFGEIFQLLDRNSGYTVTPSQELKEHLLAEFDKNSEHPGIINGLSLPPNLSILATMNTSDQSLFPMDSAFKRRWEWEYVPICYESTNEDGKTNLSYQYEIDIADGKKYNWIKFIAIINNHHIKNNQSLGMDKCIGNYFIKPDKGNSITLRPFINKVIFYLWNDVFKDEDNKVFESNGSYEDFFPIDTAGAKKIKELFERIELIRPDAYPDRNDEIGLFKVAEEKQSSDL